MKKIIFFPTFVFMMFAFSMCDKSCDTNELEGKSYRKTIDLYGDVRVSYQFISCDKVDMTVDYYDWNNNTGWSSNSPITYDYSIDNGNVTCSLNDNFVMSFDYNLDNDNMVVTNHSQESSTDSFNGTWSGF